LSRCRHMEYLNLFFNDFMGRQEPVP